LFKVGKKSLKISTAVARITSCMQTLHSSFVSCFPKSKTIKANKWLKMAKKCYVINIT
jgi:hypothetical protein